MIKNLSLSSLQKRASLAHDSDPAAAGDPGVLRSGRPGSRHHLQDLQWIAQNYIQADFQVYQESVIQL